MINTIRILQVLGILGFVLAFFQMGIGWFVGFFCSGVFFLFLKDKDGKRRSLNIAFGLLITVYSFYALYSQSSLFERMKNSVFLSLLFS